MSPPLFNNTNRIARILYRMGAYRRLSWHMLCHGVPAMDLARTQFPRLMREPQRPALVTLELTNYCNLRCVYCTSPLGLRPRGFMARKTFERFLESAHELGVSRVRVVGNGEPTLHPEFSSFIRAMGKAIPYVTVLTNGQWQKPAEVVATLLDAPVRMVEVSVDGGEREIYEKARVGASFDALLENLALLKSSIVSSKSQTRMNIRLMMRPSQRAAQNQLMEFWQNYGDSVMPQYVIVERLLGFTHDVYLPTQAKRQTYPKCSMPFKTLDVNWNGDVPLCSLSSQQMGPPGLLLGNVSGDAFADMWRGKIMREYREGHSRRDPTKMPICKGCVGA